MVRRSARFGLAAFAALVLATCPAFADDKAEAQEQFALGQKAFAAGDYRAAALAFEEAYRRKPHHSPLWNAARSWQRAGENVRAANLYQKYLREAPAGTKDRDTATAALTELRAKLGKVIVRSTGPTDLAVDEAANDPDGIYVTPGEHVVSGKSGADVVRKSVTLTAGQTLSVTLDPPPPPGGSSVKDTPPPPKPAEFHLPWVVVAIGGALTAGGGGFTIWSGLDSQSKRDTFSKDVKSDQATQGELDDGKASQLRTNIALGATIGIAALTGVAALFVDWGGKTSGGNTKSGLVIKPARNGMLVGYW